jgi:hypothetical protein
MSTRHEVLGFGVGWRDGYDQYDSTLHDCGSVRRNGYCIRP